MCFVYAVCKIMYFYNVDEVCACVRARGGVRCVYACARAQRGEGPEGPAEGRGGGHYRRQKQHLLPAGGGESDVLTA